MIALRLSAWVLAAAVQVVLAASPAGTPAHAAGLAFRQEAGSGTAASATAGSRAGRGPEKPAAGPDGAAAVAGAAASAGQQAVPAAAGAMVSEVEPGSAEIIARLTTSPRFLPEAVAAVPDSATAPAPERVLGYLPGETGRLSRTAEVRRYFRRLAEGSDRVRLEVVGHSEEGREILLVAISDAANLEQLERLREEAGRLADPRRTGDEEAARLAAGGKLIYLLVGGLDPAETAGPEMLLELAHRLVASERQEIAAIRHEAVVLILPITEPDARDRVVDWTLRHLAGRRLSWGALRPILLPPYRAHYAGALDGGLRAGLPGARAVREVFFRYHPQVLHELRSGPALLTVAAQASVPPPSKLAGALRQAAVAAAAAPLPGESPAAAAGEPSSGGDPDLAVAMARRVAGGLQAAGLPGVRAEVEEPGAEGPEGPGSGSLLAFAGRHGAVGISTRVFGNVSPETFVRDVLGPVEMREPEAPGSPSPAASGEEMRMPEALGSPPPTTTTARPSAESSPSPQSGGSLPGAASPGEGPQARWSLRDGINLAEAAALAALTDAVAHREALLAGVQRFARRAAERGRQGPPYAWAFRPVQRDPARLARLVGRLLDEGVEVGRLSADLSLDDGGLPAGSLIVRLDQPARDAALLLLGPPPSGPLWSLGDAGSEPGLEAPPGGDAVSAGSAMSAVSAMSAAMAWNLPLLAGVAGDWVDDPKILEATLDPVATGRGATPAAGVSGEGDFFLLRDQGQSGLLAAAVLLASYQIDVAELPFAAAGQRLPAGSWIVQAPRETIAALAERLGLSFTAVAEVPRVRRHVVHLPRLALLHGWGAAAGTGWARRALDRTGVPYHLLAEEELRRGHLAERFDVILVPDVGEGCDGLLRGINPRWSPLAYTRTPDSPSLGTPDAAADITGGMGEEGLAELDRFVSGGGVLAAFGSATLLPVEGGLAGGIEVLPEAGLETSRSLLWATAPEPRHPLVYGIAGTGDAAGGGGRSAWRLPGLPVWRRDGPLFAFAAGAPGSDTAAGAVVAGGESAAVGERGAPDAERSDGADRAAEAEPSTAAPLPPSAVGAAPPATASPSPGAPAAADVGAMRVLLRFGATEQGGLVAAGGLESPPGGAAAPASAPEIEVEEMEPAAGSSASAGKSEKEPATLPAGATSPDAHLAWWADPLVAAGTVQHPEKIEGRPAVLDLPRGRGHLFLFAFDPFFLDPDRADLRLVDNLLLNWRSL